MELNPDKLKRYNELQVKKQYVCDFIYDKKRRLAFYDFALNNNVPTICLFVSLHPDEFLDMLFDRDVTCYEDNNLGDVYKTMKEYEATIY
ncbi:MAG: hypothetical protein RSE25_04695 [Bacteroidales bacterium]